MKLHGNGLAGFSSIFLRLALGISFLSVVADRIGLWGTFGQPNVSWVVFHDSWTTQPG
jgi:hypothetical protein